MKRYVLVKRQNKMNKAIIKIQKFIKKLIKEKEKRKQIMVKQTLLLSLNNAWLIIINKKALKIQKNYRGWITRKNGLPKGQMEQIKEAGRQVRIEKNATLLTRVSRGYLVRIRIKRMHKAAYFIQGFVKMKWLSELFQTMRKSSHLIQAFIRMFIQKRRAFHQKYERYVLPWEKNFEQIKKSEEDKLYGASQLLTLDSPVSNGKQFQQGSTPLTQSLRQIFIPQSQRTRSESFMVNKQKQVSENCPWVYSNDETIDSILLKEQENQVLSNKINLFQCIIDLEFLADVCDVYDKPWSSTYKDILQQLFIKETPVQMLEVGETHSTVVSASGKVYTWGMNDFGQLGREYSVQWKPIGNDIKAKQISVGENHTLILGYDGQVYSYGANQQGQLGNGYFENSGFPQQIYITQEPITYIKAVTNSSFAVSASGQLFAWPLSESSRPQSIPMGNRQQVQQISCGNQFGIILLQNGQLWSFGENLEGELGLGNYQLQTDPCQIQVEKIAQIDCGFKHVIARSSLGKLFMWGWGERGQLGTSKYMNENAPVQINIPGNQKVLQVCAGHKSSIILTDQFKLYWAGSNKTIQYQSSLTEVKINHKCIHLGSGNYVPVKVQSSWSKTLSVINVTFASVKNVFNQVNPSLKQKTITHLITKWNEHGINNSIEIESKQIIFLLVDPPLVESLANFVSEKHMKKPIQVATPKSGTGKFKTLLTEQKHIKRFNNFNKYSSTTSPKKQSFHQSNQQSMQSSVYDEMKSSARQNDNHSTNNLQKLREIRKKLIQLKSIPETQWSEQDVHFIRNIYKSNLSTLLNQLHF